MGSFNLTAEPNVCMLPLFRDPIFMVQ